MHRRTGVVRQAFSVLVALLLAVMLCASAKAQTTTGAVYGTVVDTSGAVVPNASITVTNVQTGTKKTVQQTQAVITFSLFSIRVNWPSHQDRFLPSSRGESCDRYPWGDKWNPAMVPVSNRSRNAVNPDDVSAHPQGASPAGVEDLVGNVWQWTDEYTDKHTRAGILRGGSYYKPTGSVWYFPQAYDRISTANIS